MTKNAAAPTAAPDAFDGIDDLMADGPAEIRSRLPRRGQGRGQAPAGRSNLPRPAVRANDQLRTLVCAMDRQTTAMERQARRAPLSDLRRRFAEIRNRRSAELRSVVGDRDRQARTRRGVDPLTQQRVTRTAHAVGDAERAELRALRRDNVRLQREMRRPTGPTAQRGAGLSARNQAFAAYRSAMLTHLRTGQETFGGRHLRDLQRLALNTRALQTQIGQDGGYFVHPEHATGPVEQLLLELSPMRNLATVQPVSAASYKMPFNLRGASAQWVGETEPRQETNTPKIIEMEFPVMELAADPSSSQQMLDDASVDMESWLAEQVSDAFAEQEGAAFIGGNGVKKPFGLLGYEKVANASWSFGKVGYIATGADGAFGSSTAGIDRTMELVYSLKATIRQNASFLMNRGTIAEYRQIKDSQGRHIWIDGDISRGAPNTLLGYPVNEDEQMPDIGSGTFSVAFGDYKRAYIIVDRTGITVLRDPYTNKPYVMFYTTKRVGGGVKNFEAFKLLKFAAS